jgi:hypothetical protein
MSEQSLHDDRGESPNAMSRGMILLRYVLPAAVVGAGVVVMSLGSESELEGGAGIVGAGLAIFAMNWLIRASTKGDRERDREERAREYFDAHGRWPDEAAPAERSGPYAPSPSASASARGATATRRRLDRHAWPRRRGPQHP